MKFKWKVKSRQQPCEFFIATDHGIYIMSWCDSDSEAHQGI